MEPIRDIYLPLLEFDVRVVLWKGAMELPWRLGPVPVGGRKMFGVVPMPFIPWPWLNAVPGFGWAGPITSVLLQYLLATDVRIWWASVSHTKSWSSESTALEGGMGMGSKYYNEHETHKTWHDMAVVVRGAPVNDVNDHFVQVFNEARVNNAGLPASRGVSIPRLRYGDYLVLPDTSDKPLVDAIGTADFNEMLHLGVKIHRWRPAQGWSASSMLHSKVWLVDYEPGYGGLAYVGAANATQRSHIADNEAGIVSNQPDFTRQVYERVFEPDITNDSRLESGETFHITRPSRAAIRASRWLRRLLVELFWFV